MQRSPILPPAPIITAIMPECRRPLAGSPGRWPAAGPVELRPGGRVAEDVRAERGVEGHGADALVPDADLDDLDVFHRRVSAGRTRAERRTRRGSGRRESRSMGSIHGTLASRRSAKRSYIAFENIVP